VLALERHRIAPSFPSTQAGRHDLHFRTASTSLLFCILPTHPLSVLFFIELFKRELFHSPKASKASSPPFFRKIPTRSTVFHPSFCRMASGSNPFLQPHLISPKAFLHLRRHVEIPLAVFGTLILWHPLTLPLTGPFLSRLASG
jgi:hypothetical protein